MVGCCTQRSNASMDGWSNALWTGCSSINEFAFVAVAAQEKLMENKKMSSNINSPDTPPPLTPEMCVCVF